MEDARAERAGRGHTRKPSPTLPSREVSEAELKREMEAASARAISRKRAAAEKTENVLEDEKASRKTAERGIKDSNFFLKGGTKTG